MADVSYVYNCDNGLLDIQLVDNDILLANELETAVSVSMFSEARTDLPTETNIQDAISELSGWWADTFEDEPLGSEAWIYRRSKIVNETLNGLIETYTKSLQWLIDDGVAESVVVTAVKSLKIPNTIEILASITKPNEQTDTFKWAFAWGDIRDAV